MQDIRAGRRGKRVLLLGATGTIGRETARALVARGHRVVCAVRRDAPGDPALMGTEQRVADVTDPAGLWRDGLRGEGFDALVSCLASRTGLPGDAWAIDHDAHVTALEAAQRAGVAHVVQLSALCVQKPRLAFQQAKLAFEERLAVSGLTYSIVRPTAFFKSLSGQLDRLRAGKPYLLLGDGRLTACKPIAAADLGAYLADCLEDPERANRVLPIGGPGPAVTPREQGEKLFALLSLAPRFRQVPVAMLDTIVGGLALLGRVSPAMAAKAELARIGRYYATESMLVWDPAAGRYDADATPATGHQTLFDFYERLVQGDGGVEAERGAHAVF
ncbi:MAG: NAD(P)H-binding protein [Pseudomonadota bacterium]